MTYVFDFDTEVAHARTEYPEETKNTTFIDLTQSGAEEKIAAWLKENYHMIPKLVAEALKDIPEFATDKTYLEEQVALIAKELAAKMSSQAPLVFPEKMANLMVFGSKPELGFLWNPHKEALFVFRHELGHILLPSEKHDQTYKATSENTEAENTANLSEKAKSEPGADVFSLISCFKRGVLDLDDIRQISEKRLLDGLIWNDWRSNCLGHFTAPALHTLFVNENTAEILALNPQQAKMVAKIWAEKLAMPKDAVIPVKEAIEKVWDKRPFWVSSDLKFPTKGLMRHAARTFAREAGHYQEKSPARLALGIFAYLLNEAKPISHRQMAS